MKSILVSVIAAFFVVFLHGQEVELLLNLEKGKTYRQTSQNRTIMSQQVESQTINVEMEFDVLMAMTVKDITEDGYIIKVQYEELKMVVKTPFASMVFSSESDDENDTFANVMNAMKDVSFEMVMNERGKIVEVRNIESLLQAGIDNLDGLDPMQKQQAMAQISQGFGEDTFKGNIEIATAIFPEHPVKAGDKWTIQTDNDAGMPTRVTSTYTLSELTQTHAVLTGNSQIETLEKDAFMETNGMQMQFDINGAMVSRITIDRATGWIVEGQISQEISGESIIRGNPMMPDGMVIPMTILNDTKIIGQ